MKIHILNIHGTLLDAAKTCNEKDLAEYVVSFVKVGGYTQVVLRLPKIFNVERL
jgi:hypothetical protein